MKTEHLSSLSLTGGVRVKPILDDNLLFKNYLEEKYPKIEKCWWSAVPHRQHIVFPSKPVFCLLTTFALYVSYPQYSHLTKAQRPSIFSKPFAAEL